MIRHNGVIAKIGPDFNTKIIIHAVLKMLRMLFDPGLLTECVITFPTVQMEKMREPTTVLFLEGKLKLSLNMINRIK